MDNKIFEVIRLATMLVTLCLSVWVVPVLRQYIAHNVSSKELADAQKWAQIAVLAIQQTMGEAPGEERKKEAMNFLATVLSDNGIHLTVEQLSTLIESAVKIMKMGAS